VCHNEGKKKPKNKYTNAMPLLVSRTHVLKSMIYFHVYIDLNLKLYL